MPASILAVRFGSTNRGFDFNQPLATALARECGLSVSNERPNGEKATNETPSAAVACTSLGAYHGVFENAFGLILAGDKMPNITYYRCDQPLAKAVITCQV